MRTATEEPPSISEDSRSDGYLACQYMRVDDKAGRDSQELLQKDDLEVLEEGRLDFHRLAVVQHILPEQQMR